MNEELMSELAVQAASTVHEEWCMQELRAYYDRAVKSNTGNFRETFEKACFKGENRRNEVEFDVQYLVAHEQIASESLSSFESFKSLFDVGAIEVKRFVKRELTDEEKTKAGTNYRNGEENILRPFSDLSSASQKENLDAAVGAVSVFIQLSQAGISIEEMQSNPELRHTIGMAIHADWMKRNPNHPNSSLRVRYDELDEWTQGQDLTVFDALVNTVRKNPQKFAVAPVEGYVLPDYEAEERVVLGLPAPAKK